MKRFFFLPLLLLSLVTISCTTSSDVPPARLLQLESLGTQAGFSWFDVEVQQYQPNPADIQQLTSALAADPSLRFYIFVNPSCSCVGTQKLFPQLYRTLRDAGVPAAKIFAYDMRKYSAAHPHQQLLPVRQLPTIYVTKISNNQETVLGEILELPPQNVTLAQKLLDIVQ